MNIADNPGPSLENKFHFISNRTKTNKDISKGKVENPMVEEELMVVELWIIAVELHSHWLSLLQLSVSHIQECTYVFPFLRVISKQLSGIGNFNLNPQNLEVVPKKIKFF